MLRLLRGALTKLEKFLLLNLKWTKVPMFQLVVMSFTPVLSGTHSLARSVQNDVAGCLGSIGQKHLVDALGHQNLVRGVLYMVGMLIIIFIVMMGHEVD